MEKMIDLKDLLKHEILDLYSAEEQIIEALPAMIEKANNGALKTALQEHLKITEKQKSRLDEIKQAMAEEEENGNTLSPENADSTEDTEGTKASEAPKKRGFFSRLFGGEQGAEKCKGMEGLITEGNKMMGEDMSPEVLDAAIIASAQKIEHYEISGYGTARAFAKELSLDDIYNKLTETLNEEYEADDRLTALAVGKLNNEAEEADGSDNRGRRSGQRPGSGSSSKSASKGSASKGSSSKSSSSKSASKGSSSKGSSPKGSSSKGLLKTSATRSSSSKGVSKASPSKSSPSKSSSKSASKGASKGSSSRGASKGSPSKSSSKGSSPKSSSKGSSPKSSSKGSSSKNPSKSSSKSAPSKSSSKGSSSKSTSKGTGSKSGSRGGSLRRR